MQDLGTFSSANSYARAINSQGSVIVMADNGPFVWRPSTANGTSGTLSDLGGGEAFSLNGSAQVVGDIDPTGSQVVAALWQAGTSGSYTVSDLNGLIPSGTGWFLSRADAINDSGQIVVDATQNGSAYYALLLTPAPTSPALARPATSTPVPRQLTRGTLDLVVAGALLRESTPTWSPIDGTLRSAASAEPYLTEMSSLPQHASDSGSSVIAARAGSRQTLDQIFSDPDNALADPLALGWSLLG
jgi:hypothetical protein